MISFPRHTKLELVGEQSMGYQWSIAGWIFIDPETQAQDCREGLTPEGL